MALTVAPVAKARWKSICDDCAGAIAWLRQRYAAAEILGIAHSIGALLAGGAHNAAEQSRLVLIGGHTGYYGDYSRRYRLPMTLLWHALMPVVTRVFGYFPARLLGLGEDIPGTFALQWAGRRSAELRPTRAHAKRVRSFLDRCAALQRPALVVTIAEDAFATPSGTLLKLVDEMKKAGYPRSIDTAPNRAGRHRSDRPRWPPGRK